MPKRRKEAVERSVLVAAWDLFMEKGYQSTSYTDLAERSGVSRSLVQYYFPKKDLLARRCAKAIVIASQNVASAEMKQPRSQVGSAYVTSQVLLATLLMTAGSRQFLFDLLRDRDLEQQLIIQDYQLSHRAFAVADDEQARIPDKVIMVAGGLGELVYSYLTRGEVPEISSILKPMVLIHASIFGLVDEATPQTEQAALEPYALSNEALTPLAAQATRLARELLLEQEEV